MAEVIIENAEKINKNLTLNGTVKRGNFVAHDGTNWVHADASDAATNLYAQYVAMESGVSGDIIAGCKGATLTDADAPYTANSPLYTSGTAGAVTHTRPTTAADVIQNVGRASSTSVARIDIEAPKEFEVFIQPNTYDTTGEPGLGVIDSPLWVGPGLDASGEDVYFVGRFPSGVLSCDLARVVWNSIGETTGTVSGAIVVVADGATNTGDTGAAFSAAAPTSLTDDTICYSDVTAMFDAGALKSGYNWTAAFAGAGSFAGNLQCVGMYMRYTVV